MHTLYFSTLLLRGARDGGQQQGLIYLEGVPPANVNPEERDALFQTADQSTAQAARGARGLADLDWLRQQADVPGSDLEVIELEVPAHTGDQDLSTDRVKAFFKDPSWTHGLVMTAMLARRGDLRNLAIDLDFEAMEDAVEEGLRNLRGQSTRSMTQRRQTVAQAKALILSALAHLQVESA
jgi:hypothetical protein